MDGINRMNDIEFKMRYEKFHKDDNTLTCNNGVITYHGKDVITEDNIIKLGMFKLSKIDNNIWQLDNYKLFFIVSEIVKYDSYNSTYIINLINSIEGILSKTDELNDDEKDILNKFINHYIAISEYENILVGDEQKNVLVCNLSIYYNMIKKGVLNFSNKNISFNTEGYQLIQKKLFNGIITTTEQSGNSMNNGFSRSLNNGHSVLPSANITPVVPSQNSNQYNNAAFINKLMILYGIIVLGFIILLGFILS